MSDIIAGTRRLVSTVAHLTAIDIDLVAVWANRQAATVVEWLAALSHFGNPCLGAPGETGVVIVEAI